MPTPSELFTTYNPYSGIATQYSAGLDYIIANITTGDVDDLVTQVTNYVSSLGLLPNTAPVQMEISSVAYNAVNSYINGQKGNYAGGQLSFLNRMTGPSFTSGFTTDSLPTRLFDIQQNIPQAGLSVEQQQPLFLGTMIGQTSYTYWTTQIGLGGSSAWNTYLSGALTSATANMPFWVAASMQGALFGARSTFKGMIEETTQIVTVNIVSALTAALTVGAGKVMFGWIPRIQKISYAALCTPKTGFDFVQYLDGTTVCWNWAEDENCIHTTTCYGTTLILDKNGMAAGCQCDNANSIPKQALTSQVLSVRS